MTGLDLKDVVLIGRTFDEYCRLFDLTPDILSNNKILDAASGVSSFCAEACAIGYNVTASDRIYSLKPTFILDKCKADLMNIKGQLENIKESYVWNYFKDIDSLIENRAKAYNLFISDFIKYGNDRYKCVEYPESNFSDNQFDLTISSGFLFMYEGILDLEFHKRAISELIRITSKEIRIWPIIDLKGQKSQYLDTIINTFSTYDFNIKQVDYEFLKNSNEMLVINIT
ncbi:MAG: hypothetical protein HQK91_02865 [Nitrospirae bacterium]|nr:hypothetical protein [Nitrospirota bacterium]